MGQKKRHTPFVWINFGYVQVPHSIIIIIIIIIIKIKTLFNEGGTK